jgi:hypothetical protein
MHMLTVDQIKKALRDRSPTIVARETGLHPNTVRYIRDGLSTNPGHATILALSEYIESTLPEQDSGAR